ncbi:hypothetical protein [Stieleria mannarensis]|uniref:hypothetical protein n=1 Tax=Stieleria mannarensis TaxID=2755585 RepID=UPI0016045D94|nr:hypothetical protein [Rhodopirellula sp. JC639]
MLIDFDERCEAIEKEAYAFVGFGRKVILARGNAHDLPVIYVGAQDRPGKRLDCFAVQPEGSYAIELWRQRIASEHGVKHRVGSTNAVSPRTIVEDGKQEKSKIAKHFTKPFYPVKQTICMPHSFNAGGTKTDIVERLFQGNITKCSYDDNGDLVCSWELPGKVVLVVTMTFGKKSNFLPTDVKWSRKIPSGTRLLSRTKTVWKHKGDLAIPERIEAVTLSNIELHYTVDFDWKIGRELAGKSMVDPALADWREPVRVLFDVDWQRRENFPSLRDSN